MKSVFKFFQNMIQMPYIINIDKLDWLKEVNIGTELQEQY